MFQETSWTDYSVNIRGDSLGTTECSDPKEPLEVRALLKQSSGNTNMFYCKDMHHRGLHGGGGI